MEKVKMVNTRTGTVVVRSRMPAPLANAASFGGGVARAMQQTGYEMNRTGRIIEYEADKQAQKDAVNRGMEWESDFERLRREKVNSDILTRKGKQALGSTAEWEKAADEWYQQKLKEVGNDYERQALNNMYNRRNSATLDTLTRFEAQERERYFDENTTSRVNNSLNDALANFKDSRLVEQAYNSGLAAIKVNYAGRGEILDDKLKEYRSNFYKTQTLRWADEDANAASEYYAKNKSSILGSDHQAIENIIKQKKQYQEDLPYKLLQREVKVAEYKTKIGQFENQLAFDNETNNMNDSEKIRYLQENESKYSSQWFKAKQKALLSAKGITAETRAETAEKLLLDITELGSFSEEDYIRGADKVLADIEDKYAEGEISLADRSRLINNVNKKREENIVSLGEKDDWWWNFDFKDAQNRIYDNASDKTMSSKIMLDYFRTIDGQDFSNKQKKNALDKIIKGYNDKILIDRALGNKAVPKSSDETKSVKTIGKYKIEVE